MDATDRELLRRLGDGAAIDEVCRQAGMSRDEFDRWWRGQLESRLPRPEGRTRAPVAGEVEIRRDRWGIPHVLAEQRRDLFVGFGYAMAQDRLFQLDYLRRKGWGRLAEVLGEAGLASDLVARTVGLNRIARAEWARLSDDARLVLEAFADGVNAWIEQCGERLPIEFDLLDYRPQPWAPQDCLAIESEFRWYLTGRFPVIVIPELAKRALGEGELYRAFLEGEVDDESILHEGEYSPRQADAPRDLEPLGRAMGGPEDGVGSNNWVVAGRRTASGLPLLASDPHIAFEAVSCWYEVHLGGGGVNCAGMAYVGVPAVMFGRTERVAWGATNNICSQRDLYLERTDPERPDAFLYDGRYEPARVVQEEIAVKGGEPVRRAVRHSRNGPVVDEILPPEWREAHGEEVVALKWLGAYQGGWLEALLAMNRASDLEQLREATRAWHVPTFSLLAADVEGRIAYQATGRIPLRNVAERGMRPGWEPEHQWQGLIPFDGMPRVADPARGWIATANNRPAPDDYAYPLFGCWSSGWRARRIRNLVESRESLSLDDMQAMHQDTKSLRAERRVPALIAALEGLADERVRQAVELLRTWDCFVRSDSAAATLFNVFFTNWCRRVAQERFGPGRSLLETAGAELAGSLLQENRSGWFADETSRLAAIQHVFGETLASLEERWGPEPPQWHWGKLHRQPLRHVLASRGQLGELLDQPMLAVGGDMVTVCNTGGGEEWTATTGAGYRMVADLSSRPPTLLAIDAQSQSGQPGSPHYGDQRGTWLAGGYHEIRLDAEAAKKQATRCWALSPEGDGS